MGIYAAPPPPRAQPGAVRGAEAKARLGQGFVRRYERRGDWRTGGEISAGPDLTLEPASPKRHRKFPALASKPGWGKKAPDGEAAPLPPRAPLPPHPRPVSQR